MSQENKDKKGTKNSQMMKITIVSLLAVSLFLIEMYEIINDPANMVVIGSLGVFLLASVCAGMLLIRKQMEENAKGQDDAFENVYRSEKAAYLLIRKYFDKMEQKMDTLSEPSDLLYKELIAAQKALAKAQINRGKQNTNALLISNDRLMQRINSIQNDVAKLSNHVGESNQGLSEQDQAVLTEGNRQVLDKQQEILDGLKVLETSLRNEILESADKMASMKSQQMFVPQPQSQIQDHEDIQPLQMDDEFSFDHDLSSNGSLENSSESDLDKLLMEIDGADNLDPGLSPVMPELGAIDELGAIGEPELASAMPELGAIDEPESSSVMPELSAINESESMPELGAIGEVESSSVMPELGAIDEPELTSGMPELGAIDEPELSPVMPELGAINESEFMPELGAIGEPEVTPVMPESSAVDGSESSPVMPGLGAIDEPELSSMMPELSAIGEPESSPVMPELSAIEVPESSQVMPELNVIGEPEVAPVMPELGAIDEPEATPVMPELGAIDESAFMPELGAVDEPGLSPVMPELSTSDNPNVSPITPEPGAIDELDLSSMMPEMETVEKPELGVVGESGHLSMAQEPEAVDELNLAPPKIPSTNPKPASTEAELQAMIDRLQPNRQAPKTGLNQIKSVPEPEKEKEKPAAEPEAVNDSREITPDKLAAMIANLGNEPILEEPKIAEEEKPVEISSLQPDNRSFMESSLQPVDVKPAETHAGSADVIDDELEKIMMAMDIDTDLGQSVKDMDIDKILEVPIDEKSNGNANQVMSSDEIAALIANTDLLSDPEPAKNSDLPDLSDPSYVMSSDEIAALIANM